jgi:acyl carrier protein
MASPAQPSAAKSHRSPEQENLLRNLPAEARAAFERFQNGAEPDVLDPVILAILNDFAPHRSAAHLAELPGSTRLIGDLGFDSLAITEVVFSAEDLFGISITNREIAEVRTLDDLRAFIRSKVAARSTP